MSKKKQSPRSDNSDSGFELLDLSFDLADFKAGYIYFGYPNNVK